MQNNNQEELNIDLAIEKFLKEIQMPRVQLSAIETWFENNNYGFGETVDDIHLPEGKLEDILKKEFDIDCDCEAGMVAHYLLFKSMKK